MDFYADDAIFRVKKTKLIEKCQRLKKCVIQQAKILQTATDSKAGDN